MARDATGMSLDIGAALRDGTRRTVKRNGLLLMSVFLVLGSANTLMTQSVTVAAVEAIQQLPTAPPPETSPAFDDTGPTPFAIDLPLPVAAGGLLLLALVAEAVTIIAVRTLVSDATRGIPAEFLRRNIAWATLNGFIGGIVVAVLIGIGFVLLIIPGIFLAISFFFVRQEIAVEDVNFVDAMAGSWELAAGNRIELLVLAIVLLIISLLASVPALATSLLGPEASVLTGVVIGAVTTVFNIAVVARAYDQLRTEREADPEPDDDVEDDGLTRADDDSEFTFDV